MSPFQQEDPTRSNLKPSAFRDFWKAPYSSWKMLALLPCRLSLPSSFDVCSASKSPALEPNLTRVSPRPCPELLSIPSPEPEGAGTIEGEVS